MAEKITLGGSKLTLKSAQMIADGAPVSIAITAIKKIADSKALVQTLFKQEHPIYGVNTGFGFLASHKIPSAEVFQLQVNLVRSHAAGFGTALSIKETRLAMALRLHVLLQGMAGVTLELCHALKDLIHAEIYPIIPEYGSVGASGDLAPLAHLALPIIGEGKVHYKGKIISAKQALKSAGLKPYTLQEKEGIALINGTQIMLAVGALALIEAHDLAEQADKICALSYEALSASPDALDPAIHTSRHQLGQIRSASKILKNLQGSELFSSQTKRMRLQDPYSLRCAPQIHGASIDALAYVTTIVERELNAVTDNPLVFANRGKIRNGGNFHGQPVAMAYDFASIALAELGNVSERRLELLLNPHFSGLPPFLSPHAGLNSGYMAAQYLSASLVNENKLLANPSCTDSIPGNAGIEDHVSMGMASAKKFKKIAENLRVILAIEMMAGAQGIDLRRIKKLGKGTTQTYARVRQKIPMLNKDRIISEDIAKAVAILKGEVFGK